MESEVNTGEVVCIFTYMRIYIHTESCTYVFIQTYINTKTYDMSVETCIPHEKMKSKDVRKIFETARS